MGGECRMKVLVVADHLDRAETETLLGLHRDGIGLSALIHPAVPTFEQLHDLLPDVTPLTLRGWLDRTALSVIRDKLSASPFDVLYMTPSKRAVFHGLLASRDIAIKRVAYQGCMGNLSRLDPVSHLSYLSPMLDKVICACDAVREDLRRLGVSANVLVRVYKGHDPQWCRSAPRKSLMEFGIPRDAFVVTCAGHLNRRKGIPVLLRALERITYASCRPVHALLIGDISDGRVRRHGRGRGLSHRVHFAGQRADAAALVGASDAFVMPSVHSEGLSRPVVEAMAQSVPVIVSDAGGLPELVRDGETGHVVRAGDSRALADAIAGLATSPARCREFGAAAHQRIVKHYAIAATVSKMVDEMRSLVASEDHVPELSPVPVNA